jgi:outer membrane protein assembly factor BamB
MPHIPEADPAPLPPIESTLPASRSIPLWPALAIIGAMGLLIGGGYLFFSEDWLSVLGLFIGISLGGLLLLVWWFSFSRLTWRIKGWGLLLFAVAVVLAVAVSDSTIWLMILLWGAPFSLAALVVYWTISGVLPVTTRTIGLGVVGLVSLAPWALLRMEGMVGQSTPHFFWRWTLSTEDQFLQYLRGEGQSNRAALPQEKLYATAADWTGFRGPNRDGMVPDVQLSAEWIGNPGEPLWRHPVGLGWSSCTVVGDYLFTQEQRDNEETVVCYEAATGKQVWEHKDDTRFSEVAGGDGPRATPTFHDNRLYTMGANGLLNCLDARTGERIWSKDVTRDNDSPVPVWGFATSPLIWNNLVIVQGGGKDGQPLLLAYDIEKGKRKWAAGSGMTGYSSPRLTTLAGVAQILMVGGDGLSSHDPAKGTVLWQHDWPLTAEAQIVAMPWVIDDHSVIVGAAQNAGLKRLHVDRDASGKWIVNEDWHSKRFNPHFNDFICHKGHLYGLNFGILNCVDLATGNTVWRGGRYGNGQILLAGSHLLIASEDGEVVLVDANPGAFQEIGRFQAVAGKTWNHPVLNNGRLFVRNSGEMVCFGVAGKN